MHIWAVFPKRNSFLLQLKKIRILEAKINKSKTTSFSQTFKVSEYKVPLFFYFLPLDRDIDELCF